MSRSVQATMHEPATGGTLSALIECTKPGITRLVCITAGVGFAVGAVGRTWDVPGLLLAATGCLIGTALSASGANTLNQWMERDRDALMARTCSRPLPSGRLRPRAVLLWGVLLAILGVAALALTVGPVAAGVSLVTILTYLFLYTPLKPITPLATWAGAIPGALPPVIGWTAARSDLAVGTGWDWAGLTSAGPWLLFAIMFIWQIPHFLAIALMYRDQYREAGYRVLPAVESSGRLTRIMVLAWTLLLIPVSMAPAWFVPALSFAFAGIALLTGLLYLWTAFQLVRKATRDAARTVFLASIVHLPILFVAMVADAMLALVW